VVGSVVFEVTTAPGGTVKAPADLAIPRAADVGIPSLAERADEPSITGGKWHSAEPITIDFPQHDRELSQRWRDRLTGKLWMAERVAMGTRYLAQPIEDSHDRMLVGAKEWLTTMVRVDDGK
jgi:hypothetical protein